MRRGKALSTMAPSHPIRPDARSAATNIEIGKRATVTLGNGATFSVVVTKISESALSGTSNCSLQAIPWGSIQSLEMERPSAPRTAAVVVLGVTAHVLLIAALMGI